MDVVGVGYARTGTASLKQALQQLGLDPCYHMYDVFADPARVAHWERVAAGERPPWDEVFAGFRATVDWPGSLYWRELVDAYPDAPVLLTVRDSTRWYDSVRDTIYPLSGPGGAFDSAPAGTIPEPIRRMCAVIQETVWNGIFDGRFPDREHAISVYERHNAEVVAAVAPERLLVMEVSEGWGPLCKHLGIGLPTDPFPHLNDTASIRATFAHVLDGDSLEAPFHDGPPS